MLAPILTLCLLQSPARAPTEVAAGEAAYELLMPAHTFATDLAQFGTSLQAVKGLRSQYVASSEAVLIRLAQMSPSPCAVVFLSEKLKPTEERAAATQEFDLGLRPVPTKLRVDYVRPSPSFPIFIPQDKSVPDTSSAYKCLQTDDVASGIERWDISGFGNWSVQAAPLPEFEDGTQRVAALVVVQT